MALQGTRPKTHDRDGGRQWFYDVKAVLRVLRHSTPGFDAERFLSLTGYSDELARGWGVE